MTSTRWQDRSVTLEREGPQNPEPLTKELGTHGAPSSGQRDFEVAPLEEIVLCNLKSHTISKHT